MWDSALDEFNVKKMGPRRDVLSEIFETARSVTVRVRLELLNRVSPYKMIIYVDYCENRAALCFVKQF
jgi:hypothetical protein